jgi:hypothetical protein
MWSTPVSDTLAPGTKVKVQFDGTVVDAPSTGEVLGADNLATGFVLVQDSTRTIHAIWYHPAYTDNVVLKIDEPEYINGEVYRDKDGSLWMYDEPTYKWFTFGSTYAYSYETPVRPLTLYEG